MKRQKDINCAGGAIRPIMKRHRGQYDAGYELLDMSTGKPHTNQEYCELHLLTKGGTSNHEDRGKDASNSSTLALDAAGARREDWIGKERSKSHSPI